MSNYITRFINSFGPSQSITPNNGAAKSATAAPSSELVRGDEARRYKITAAIPDGAIITGDLVLSQSAIIGGTVEGKVAITGERMAAFIKKGAVIHGGISASVVIIFGEVYGSVEADYVRIHEGGSVRGVIRTESLVVERGSLLLGADTRVAPPCRPPPPPPPPIDAEVENTGMYGTHASSTVASARQKTVLTPEQFRDELRRIRSEAIFMTSSPP
ncbi:MAG: hypothetical protein DDT25_00063 [Chloroflexi bacterium]|nr:hypothetical protein [Chloroflexota bacterium]